VFILYDEEHHPVSALGAMTDISDRVRMEAALRESEERFRRAVGSAESTRTEAEGGGRILVNAGDALRLSAAIVENLVQAIIIVRKADFLIAFTNPRAEEMFGYGPGELVGKPVTILNAPGGASADELASHINDAIQREGIWRGEFENVTKDGRKFTCQATLTPLEHSELGPVFLSVQEDITEKRDSARRQRLITEELDHRVKNNLAAILGLATQTARRAESVDDFTDAFVPRLHAMARVHEALASGGWDELQLESVIDQTVRLHATGSGQITASGPCCALSSRAASALGPALHELATNAVKYGSLSTESGRVEIEWECDPEGGLALRWSELDGPAGSGEPEPGFGLTLVRGLIEQQIGGEVRFDFGGGGAHHEIRIPGEGIA
jgi:PAS domain S-box-containing protein